MFRPGSTGCLGAGSTGSSSSALGITWILDGLEVTLVGSLSGAINESPTLRLSGGQIGASASAYLIGARRRRAVLRLADRPARAQEAVHHHGAGLPRRHDRLRPGVEFLVVRVVPHDHRRRHRRRIRGGECDDPGTDSRAAARLHRSRHQRQFLDRRGAGRARRSRGAQSAHRCRRTLAGARPSSSAA